MTRSKRGKRVFKVTPPDAKFVNGSWKEGLFERYGNILDQVNAARTIKEKRNPDIPPYPVPDKIPHTWVYRPAIPRYIPKQAHIIPLSASFVCEYWAKKDSF